MAGLAAIAADAVKSALDVADDLKTPATLRLGETQAYDYATDKNTPTGGSAPTAMGIFWGLRRKKNAENTTSEAKFLVAATDAPNGITEADSATINDQTWEIDMVEPIAGVAYILHLRK